MDDSDRKHPDPILYRYLRLLERATAYGRVSRIIALDGANSPFVTIGVQPSPAAALKEKNALDDERASIVMEVVAKMEGIKDLRPEDAKTFTGPRFARLMCMYEWHAILRKDPSDPVWGGPTPWRDEAMLDVKPGGT